MSSFNYLLSRLQELTEEASQCTDKDDESSQHILAEAMDVIERAKNPELNDQESPVDIGLLKEKISDIESGL